MKIAFASGMAAYPWGGSEVLWSQAALRLKREGHQVFACVQGWPKRPVAVQALADAGIELHEKKWFAQSRWSRWGDAVKRRVSPGNAVPTVVRRANEALLRFSPDLVCAAHGGAADAIEWMELCKQEHRRYVSLAQAHRDPFARDDAHSDRLRSAYLGADLAFFVSRGNREGFEIQIGTRLPNARVVWNPFQVDRDAAPPWPDETGTLRLACVGRLSPDKGQDLVLQILATAPWRKRSVQVSFFGSGPVERSLRRLAEMLGVEEKVRFVGHVDSVESIWTSHEALLLPSRSEGMPLALIEAMLCGRTAVVTDVAGNKELVDDDVTGFVAAAPTVGLVAEAMERAWLRRTELREMGANASIAIRSKLPRDPVGDFAKMLVDCARSDQAPEGAPSIPSRDRG